MKAVVAAFNQEKALVGAFSVITNLRMDPFEAQVRRQRRAEPGIGRASFSRGSGLNNRKEQFYNLQRKFLCGEAFQTS